MAQIPDTQAPWRNGVRPNRAAANEGFQTAARWNPTLSPPLWLSPPPASPLQKGPGAGGGGCMSQDPDARIKLFAADKAGIWGLENEGDS